ncbi:MAG: holo-ACP synthase [Synergistaceae bacterium]|nr:holo-ACP synthase [Synergistaceae bacterium]
MIAGIGVDLCSIARMEKAVKGDHFVRRIFRPKEIAYANAKGNNRARAASFAAAFAAREAFAKASGISMYHLTLSSRICLEREEGQPPHLVVPPELDDGFTWGYKRAWVSLSHDGDYAVAVVVIEATAGP